MNGWSIVLILPVLFLCATLGPWLLLPLLQKRVQASLPPEPLSADARALEIQYRVHRERWVAAHALGTGSDPERAAAAALKELQRAVEGLRVCGTTVDFYYPEQPSLVDALKGRAWAPFLEASRVRRSAAAAAAYRLCAQAALDDLADRQGPAAEPLFALHSAPASRDRAPSPDRLADRDLGAGPAPSPEHSVAADAPGSAYVRRAVVTEPDEWASAEALQEPAAQPVDAEKAADLSREMDRGEEPQAEPLAWESDGDAAGSMPPDEVSAPSLSSDSEDTDISYLADESYAVEDDQQQDQFLVSWPTGDVASVDESSGTAEPPASERLIAEPTPAGNDIASPNTPAMDPSDLAELRSKALWHIQMGEWPAAIGVLEQLARADPHDRRTADLLDEARFKASLGGDKGIRPRRWSVAWRRVGFASLMVLAILAIVAVGARVLTASRPDVDAAVREQQQDQLYEEGNAFLRGRDLDAAEERFQQLLAQDPASEQAQEGLAAVADARATQQLYDRALAAEKVGDNEAALAALQEVAARVPGYQDSSQRIATLEKIVQLDRLYHQAEADFQAGRDADAMRAYEQLRSTKTDYRPKEIAERLHSIYMSLGRQAIAGSSERPEGVAEAREFFARALTLKPGDQVAAQAQRLAARLAGAADLLALGRWDEVIVHLQALGEADTAPAGDAVTRMLYDAYIASGEQHEKAGDLDAAAANYRLALALPLAETSLARERLAALGPTPALTPEATQEPTAAPTTVPTAAPTVTRSPAAVKAAPAKVAPTKVAPKPTAAPKTGLSAYKGYIVFLSNKDGEPSYWVASPTGQERRKLGYNTQIVQEYQELVLRQRRNPQGSEYVFVDYTDKVAQLCIGSSANTGETSRRLNFSVKSAYDPAWSPAGNQIAFVSRGDAAYDIWVIGLDGSSPRNLTASQGADVRPSWSPDGSRIVFSSDRGGVRQLYIMDSQGGALVNISNTSWHEYDPIWIR